jgi:long-chain fatty acid transport protein
MRLLGKVGTAIGVAAVSSPVGATGFYLQEQSVEGAGRANSGEVADRGPAALWWNPAAIGGAEESEANASVSLVLTDSRLIDSGSNITRPGAGTAPVGGRADVGDPVGSGIIPKLSVAVPLGRRWAAGLAITAPYGLSSRYEEGDWTRYSALESSLATVDIQPSLAFAPTNSLSLGIGLNVEHADAKLSNALPNLAGGLPDGSVTIRGKGWDVGWSAGVQLRASRVVTVGLSYKSSIEHRLSGAFSIEGLLGPIATLNGQGPVKARFRTPSQLYAGARIEAAPGLTLNLQAARLGWSRFDTIEIGPPLSQSLIQDYRNTWSFGAGADWDVSTAFTLRAGVQAAQTPIRDSLRDPKVPDSDRMTYGAGASWRAGGGFSLDAAVSYVVLEGAPVSRDDIFYGGTPLETRVLTRGRTQGNNALLLSLGSSVRF